MWRSVPFGSVSSVCPFDLAILWDTIRLLCMAIVYVPYLGLYSLAYIRPYLIRIIFSF